MEHKIDLDDPKDARKFLRGVQIEGLNIEFIELSDGRQLMIEDMNDDEVVRYAKDVYFDYCGGVEGEDGSVDLHGVDQ